MPVKPEQCQESRLQSFPTFWLCTCEEISLQSPYVQVRRDLKEVKALLKNLTTLSYVHKQLTSSIIWTEATIQND